MISQNQNEYTILLFGRTGTGKSSLGNMLAAGVNADYRNMPDHFKVGTNLMSETFDVTEKNFEIDFGKNMKYKIKLIDNPGFADNRVKIENDDIIQNILKFFRSINGKFNLALYLFDGNRTRLDSYDIDEIKILQAFLGENVISNIIFTFTKLNTLVSKEKKQMITKFKKELPLFLKKNNIKISSDQILISDFDKHSEFMSSLFVLLYQKSVYEVDIPKGLDLDSKDSIKQMIESTLGVQILSTYLEVLNKREQKLLEEKNDYKELGTDYEDELEEVTKKLEAQEKQIKDIIKKKEQAEKSIGIKSKTSSKSKMVDIDLTHSKYLKYFESLKSKNPDKVSLSKFDINLEKITDFRDFINSYEVAALCEIIFEDINKKK